MVKKLKVLNCYAGIGGNRKLWEDVEVTAVENVPEIAKVYQELFPDDEMVVADAHQYLLDHHKEFDFIWSSPPCPTHSRLNTQLYAQGYIRYPDMTLYQEVIFLKHFYKGKWVVENVEPYYQYLMRPTVIIERHPIWSNFHIWPVKTGSRQKIEYAESESLAADLGIELPEWVTDKNKFKRKLLRNAVNPLIGLHILKAAQKEVTQDEMSFHEALTSIGGLGV